MKYQLSSNNKSVLIIMSVREDIQHAVKSIAVIPMLCDLSSHGCNCSDQMLEADEHSSIIQI